LGMARSGEPSANSLLRMVTPPRRSLRHSTHDDRDASVEEVLLKRNFLIGGDHDVETRIFGCRKKSTVFQAGETGVGRSLAVVLIELQSQTLIDALIDEDTHQT
ncbi:MAG: hypothetical protein J0L64_24670, partial [Acidobacteria bacterium]|nr:hypothetical protein [Acidobacteriota bacterium]